MPTPRSGRIAAACLIAGLALPLTAQATNPLADQPRVSLAVTTPAADDSLGQVRLKAEAGDIGAMVEMSRAYRDATTVEADPVQAFRFDRLIVERHAGVEPASPDAALVAEAVVRLAETYRTGLPAAGISPRPDLAMSLLTHGASYLGDPEAQYALGVILLEQAGADDREARHAARWLLLAARKGHVGAQVALGQHLSMQASEASRMRGAYWLETAAAADNERVLLRTTALNE